MKDQEKIYAAHYRKAEMESYAGDIVDIIDHILKLDGECKGRSSQSIKAVMIAGLLGLEKRSTANDRMLVMTDM